MTRRRPTYTPDKPSRRALGFALREGDVGRAQAMVCQLCVDGPVPGVLCPWCGGDRVIALPAKE